MWTKNRFTQMLQSQFAKDTAVLTLGTTAAQLLGIATMPVLARLYSPADFGVLAVFLAVSGIVAITITLRYEMHILLPKEENEAATLVFICLSSTLFLGVLLATMGWLLPEKFREIIGVSILGNWLPIAILSGMGGALLATGMAWLNRQRAYLKMAKLRFIQSLLVAPVVILLGLYGYKTGLLVAQVVALVIMSAVFLVLISGIQINRHELAMKEVAAKHIVAPKYLLPTAFLDTVTQQLPILLITAWYSSEAAGQFSMAWKILALPMTLIGGAVGQVFIQRFSQLWPDALSARKLLFKTWKVLALIGLIPTVLIMLFGEQIFGWVLGSAWVGAGRIAGVIAPMLFAMLISSTTSGIFLTLGLQKFSLFFGVSFILYRSGSMYFGVIYNSVLYGLAAWVLCEIVAISVYNWIALKRISK